MIMRLYPAVAFVLFLSSSRAYASEEGLMSIDIGLLIWTWASFFLLLYVLSRFAYRPLMFLVAKREKRIKESLREAEKAKKQAEAISGERERALMEAQNQASEIIARARDSAESEKRRIMNDTREEANRMLNKAEEEIRREKRQALSELSDTVADLAIGAAERIVKASLDGDTHRRLIDEVIEELEKDSERGS